MKKLHFILPSLLLPFTALANGTDNPSIGHQLQEFLPFEHLEHGHWFGAIISVVLWLSFIYAIYALAKKFRRGPTI